MGFTDRFKEAAEATRARLTDDGTAVSGAIHGVHAISPQPNDLDVAARAMERGAPDPYSLITHDEVVALTGIPVGGPSLTYADDDLGVRFDAQDGRQRMWSFVVRAGYAADDVTRFDPESWYTWIVDLVDDPEPVPDLGDAAVYGRGSLYVRGHDRAFYVLVDAPEESPVKLWATALARRVLERFSSGEAH
ncbi:MAG TPA: hypothetical protein VFW63_09075 [Acidimicrobiales bacterium]|nr:hypothetical protein [Acidimicrobiales bacterium]